MKQDIEIVRGTTNSFGILIADTDGSIFTLGDDQTLVFAVKKQPKDEERVLVKKITTMVDSSGVYLLELFPADTAELEPGRYVYDVGLQDGSDDFYNVIKTSAFDILPNVTQLGDGG